MSPVEQPTTTPEVSLEAIDGTYHVELRITTIYGYDVKASSIREAQELAINCYKNDSDEPDNRGIDELTITWLTTAGEATFRGMIEEHTSDDDIVDATEIS